MAPNLCFIVCDYLYPEMKAAVKAEGISEVEVKTFPARCGRPPVCWQELIKSIDASEADFVEVFGCYCLQGLGSPAPEFSHYRINRQEQCFHLLYGQTLVSDLQQEGAYLLTPGWLAHWQQHVSDWGFDRETAADFFEQSINSLLLLDTGIDERAKEHLDDFSSFLDLPCKTLPIGLDFHRLALVKIVAGYRQQAIELEKEKALRHSADSAMALDLLGRITRASSEAEVIDAIVELFTMLLAPDKIIYVRVINTRMQLDQVVDLTSEKRWQLEKFYTQSQKNYQLNASGDSFLLRMGRGNNVSAVLSVQRVTFPQYIEYYLNVAIHVSGVCALAIEHARTMEKLLDTSRLAGKAEVATEVLHNVGNTLNSISVSSERIREMVEKSSCCTLPGIVNLIEQHTGDTGNFFCNDPKGKKLPLYFSKLSELLTGEQKDLLDETTHQLRHIRRVAEIIRTQQDAARGVGLSEHVDMAALIEECLQVFEGQIKDKQINVKRDYSRLPIMHGERHKILQVVSNLISNAVDALDEIERENRRLFLRLYSAENNMVMLEVHDNGVGISSRTMSKIFVFGFTTKKNGHGFGLHNAANLTTAMGGTLTAESSGKRKGAIFRLQLPLTEEAGGLDGRKQKKPDTYH